MRIILILAACFSCLCARSQTLQPIEFNVFPNPAAVSYSISWGTSTTNQPNQIVISGASITNVYKMQLLADPSTNCVITQVTTLTNGQQAKIINYFGPRTNLLSTICQTAPTPDGPWTNYLGITSLVDSNACGFYRIIATMKR